MQKMNDKNKESTLVDLFRTEKRKINDLIPFEGNPRAMNEHQVNALKKSLKKFGVAELPVIDADNVIVAGHQRLKALQDMGYGEAEIDVRVASRKLTDKEFAIYNIGSNKITGDFTDELFNFDEEILLESGFTQNEIDISALGVEDIGVDKSFNSAVTVGSEFTTISFTIKNEDYFFVNTFIENNSKEELEKRIVEVCKNA